MPKTRNAAALEAFDRCQLTPEQEEVYAIYDALPFIEQLPAPMSAAVTATVKDAAPRSYAKALRLLAREGRSL